MRIKNIINISIILLITSTATAGTISDNFTQKDTNLQTAIYVAGGIFTAGLIYQLSDKPETVGGFILLGMCFYSGPRDDKGAWMFGIPMVYDFTLAKGRPRDEVFITNILLLGLAWLIIPENKSTIPQNTPLVHFDSEKTYLVWNYKI